jgi:hypothetical protein
MIDLGKVQTLKIMRITSIGAYLGEDSNKDEVVLLPEKELPKKCKVGDETEVFIYRDSKDRLIATLRRPRILLGEFVSLKVVDITKVGAFLDWGLEKDLLLPYSEQILKVHKGRKYLVNLYIDKSKRLCATMRVYPLLSTNSGHKTGDWVEGFVYQINPDVGAFIAVENAYHGLIPKQDLLDDIHCGDIVKARVREVSGDGKLTLSPTRKAYKEIPTDAMKILTLLEENDDFLPFNDNTKSELINKIFKMSKSSFKRALGKLLKEKKIIMTEKGIKKHG